MRSKYILLQVLLLTLVIVGVAPARQAYAVTWRSVSAGVNFTAAINGDGTLWAWGGNYNGQLGDGSTIDRTSSVQIGTATNWHSVSAGDDHTVAIKGDGTLWVWGSNYYGSYLGALGDWPQRDITSPVQIGSDTNWQSVSAGWYHTVAIMGDGTLRTWGRNRDGQLGVGDTTTNISPFQVGTATNWQSASAGGAHTVAIKGDGTLWAWGGNGYGQLGDGSTTTRTSPVQIGTATNWQSVSAGGLHTVALKGDGTLWAWGWNAYGQLGDGSTTTRTSPVQIGTATNWQSVSAGWYHIVALKGDGTLWAWGYNIDGQLGDGSTTTRTSPVQIGTATNWQSVSAGGLHTVAFKGDGTLWVWGFNQSGQLGDGSTTTRTAPTLIQFHTVTPSATNAAVTPNAAQSVAFGGTANFTITPNAGYYLIPTGAGGSCPQGAWNGTTYTTGTITTDCTVAPKLYQLPTARITKDENIPNYLRGGVTATVSGTATSDPSFSVSKVEISTNGGTVWQNVTGTISWSWNGTLPATGTFQVRATDSNSKVGSVTSYTLLTSSVIFYLKGTDAPMGSYKNYTLAMLNWSGTPVSTVAIDIGNASGSTYKFVQQQPSSAIAAIGKVLGSNYITSTTMRLSITGASQTAIPDGDIAYLSMSVGAKLTGVATYTPYPIILTLTPSSSSQVGNLIPSTGVNAAYTARLLADRDNSNTVDVAEIQRTANMLLKVSYQPVESSVDIDGDGVVTIGDLQLAVMANLGTLGFVSSSPPPNATILATLNLAAPQTSLTPGSTITIPIQLNNSSGEGVAATSNRIIYDPNLFEIVSVSNGAAATAAGKSVNYNVASPGELIVAVYGVNQTPISNGVVANLTMRVRTNPTGTNKTIQNIAQVVDTAGNLRLISTTSVTLDVLLQAAQSALPITWYHKGAGSVSTQTTNGSSITSGVPIWNEPNPAWSIVGSGDFNKDGIPDYAWYNSTTGQAALMLMQTATQVLSTTIVHTQPDTAWRIVATGDVTGDGTSDLIWQNRQSGAVYIMPIINATVQPGAVIHTETDTSWKIVAAADSNGNGTTDLIWWHTVTGQVALMTTNGLNPVGKQTIYQEANTNWRIVAAGDINSDSKADLIWKNRISGQIYAMTLNGSSVTGGATIATEPDTTWDIINLGSYSGTTTPSLLWWNSTTGQLGLMPVTGLTATTRTNIYQESDTTWRPQGSEAWLDTTYGQSATTAHSDSGQITWGNTQTGTIYGMTTNNATVISGGTIHTEANTAWSIVGQGDFDGDGIKDLIWRNITTGQIYLMLKKNTTEQKSGHMLYQEPNTNWNIVATGDLNGDGTSDLIWWNSTTGQVYGQTITNGQVTSGSIIYTEPDTHWKIVGTGDVNSNGTSDLIWWNNTTGQIAIGTTRNLDQSSAQVIYTEANTNWRIAGVGDINSDGKSDLIWHNKTTGQVYGMLLNGSAVIGGGMIHTEPDTNWDIASIGDLTNDGKADILWHNTTTGQVYQMELNGLSISKSTLIYQEANTTWHIQGETEWRDKVYGVGVTTTK